MISNQGTIYFGEVQENGVPSGCAFPLTNQISWSGFHEADGLLSEMGRFGQTLLTANPCRTVKLLWKN